jgi:hypothetical protein
LRLDFPQKRADVMHDWHKTLLHGVVPSLIKKWELRLNVKVVGYFLQRMKTKWGSCKSEGKTHPSQYATRDETEGPGSRTWAFTQRRKMLCLLAISQRRRRIAFLTGMTLLLVLVAWLRLSGKAHAWHAKLVSAMSWILAHPPPLPWSWL